MRARIGHYTQAEAARKAKTLPKPHSIRGGDGRVVYVYSEGIVIFRQDATGNGVTITDTRK